MLQAFIASAAASDMIERHYGVGKGHWDRMKLSHVRSRSDADDVVPDTGEVVTSVRVEGDTPSNEEIARALIEQGGVFNGRATFRDVPTYFLDKWAVDINYYKFVTRYLAVDLGEVIRARKNADGLLVIESESTVHNSGYRLINVRILADTYETGRRTQARHIHPMIRYAFEGQVPLWLEVLDTFITDHISGDRSDARFINLRLAPKFIQDYNRTVTTGLPLQMKGWKRGG